MVASPTAEQAAILQKSTLKDGAIPNALRTMAHNAELLKRMNALGGYFLRFGVLPERTTKLVILRVAHRTDSLYEFANHREMALAAGALTAEEIDGVASASFPWKPEDRVYLAAVDELIEHDCIGDDAWRGLSRLLAADALVELVLLVGFYRTLAGFLNSVGVVLDERVKDRLWPAGRDVPAAAGLGSVT